MPKQNLTIIANYLQSKTERSSYISIEVNEAAGEIIIRGLHYTDFFIQHVCRVARTEALNFTINSSVKKDTQTPIIETVIIIYSIN